MDWIALSFLGAICYSAHSLLQKYAFQRYVQSILAFNFWGESFQAVVGLTILWFHPVPYPLFSWPVFLLLAGGVIRIGNVLLRAWAIQREEEVSRIVPVLDTYPVFVAVLALLTLGERLALVHWIGIGLVVVGAFIASSHEALANRQFRSHTTVLIALCASLSMGTYSVVGKASLEYVSVWHLLAFSSFFTVPTAALVAGLHGAWPELASLSRKPKPLGITAVSAAAIMLAFGVGFMAFERGPVALSSAIMATRPILIVVFVVLASYIFPRLAIEPTARAGLRTKAAAAGLVTLGVAGIAFG